MDNYRANEVSSFGLGYFGNIWVRENILFGVGTKNTGHKHHFDHVSLLTQGSVRVSIEGHEPKEFSAPTFIVVRKEHKHTFESLSDKVVWYCVFALRDFDGEVIEDIYGQQHDPLSYAGKDAGAEEYKQKMAALEKNTTHE